LAISISTALGYDWLVISGTQAQYKGTGTINGAGSFNFMGGGGG
jgi:hypothetical protein